MRIVTVQGYWAWAIAAGHKPVENRGYNPPYRGPLAIHVGTSVKWDHESLRFLRRMNIEPPAELQRGHILAVCEFTDALEYEPAPAATLIDPDERDPRIRSPWAFGPYCWCLADVRALPSPIPWVGTQGLRELPLEIRATIARQL